MENPTLTLVFSTHVNQHIIIIEGCFYDHYVVKKSTSRVNVITMFVRLCVTTLYNESCVRIIYLFVTCRVETLA